MCGVVGYLGPRPVKEVLLNGLKKLEYRGYDSSGLAALNNESFEIYKATGHLCALNEELNTVNFNGPVGIAHTRWATHGPPTQNNAHPHKIGPVSLVHNGIIENYLEIKKSLLSEGFEFLSQTDSEVITALIAFELTRNSQLITALQKVMPQIHGAYASLVVSETDPHCVVAFKSGPPLILGLGQDFKEFFLASDPQGFVEYTKKVIYIEDDQLVWIKGQEYKIFNSKGEEVFKEPQNLDVGCMYSDKKGFKHYMLKEIFEQPQSVAQSLKAYTDSSKKKLDFSSLGIKRPNFSQELQGIKRINMVACGSSFYGCLYGKYLIESLARIPVQVDVASEFRYRRPIFEAHSLTFLISQSGETADTLSALKLSRKESSPTLILTNTKGSTMDRESDMSLYMNCGLEVGVASTKAFLSTLCVLNLFSLFLAQLKGVLSSEEESHFLESMWALPGLIEAVLSYDTFFQKVSPLLRKCRNFLYLARGHNFPVAMEGALKLKELAYVQAEGYAAGEMKHGPLALVDRETAIIVMCPRDAYYEKTMSNLQEVKARGGLIISIGSGGDEELSALSEHYLSIPDRGWMTTGLLSTIPVQLLSYHLANNLGRNVDQPRNLAKSVTVE